MLLSGLVVTLAPICLLRWLSAAVFNAIIHLLGIHTISVTGEHPAMADECMPEENGWD